MKGQKLFVRPIEASDAGEIRALAARHGGSPDVHSGLVGKLVGDLVAVLTMEVTETAIRVEELIVAEELRGKRVGRVMMNELHALAAKMDRKRIEADRGAADGFLRRVGFEEEGTKWVRRVSGR